MLFFFLYSVSHFQHPLKIHPQLLVKVYTIFVQMYTSSKSICNPVNTEMCKYDSASNDFPPQLTC